MTKTMDEWFAEFQAICFSGYFCQGDAATRYRSMEHANVKLKDVLRRFHDEIKPRAPVTQAAGPQNTKKV